MKKKGFTLIELLVVIAIIALLLAILLPSLNRAKELAKRVYCLSNTKSLTMAWIMYTEDNDGEIINSSTTDAYQRGDLGWAPAALLTGAPDWLKKDVDTQLADLEKSALFPYLGDSKGVFRCPTQKKELMSSYSISHAMNWYSAGYEPCPNAPYVRKISDIKSSGSRLVFIDEYDLSNSSWGVWYEIPAWMDRPSMQHGDGTTFSFADGHNEYWKWKDEFSKEIAAMSTKEFFTAYPTWLAYPPALERDDLQRVHRAAWGKIGW